MLEEAILPFRTFRDPAGNVQLRADGAYREVHSPFDQELLDFLQTPLAARLVSSNRLVDTEILTAASGANPLLVRHPLVAFRSYPWEWAPALWLSAAELTLDLSTELLEEGWILKDATPLNILFRGVDPIFVDVLSITRADLSHPLWFAYGQFVRTFILPLVAHSVLGWPLQVSLNRRDGYEPEHLYSALSPLGRLRQPVLSTVTLPVLLGGKRSSPASPAVPASRKDPELTAHVLRKTYAGLLSQVRRAVPAARASTWSHYTQTATHYSEVEHAEKKQFVASALSAARPSRVLDVGCNTGTYSMLAAQTGAEVVSIDTDLQAVERLSIKLKGSHTPILPLCVDLSRPTPATGWENAETASFLERAEGHFDTVLMLAVLHHLLIGSQIPMEQIASLVSRLTTANLIIEWIPPTDPMFQAILRGREALYAHITEESFRSAFFHYFRSIGEKQLANGRILLHLERA